MAAATTPVQGEWYTVDCSETPYTLPVRYQDLVPIERGASSTLIRATDTITGEHVAIKKMFRPFQVPTHAKRAYRELKLLIELNHPDAEVVQLYNVFTPDQNVDDFQTMYLVFNFIDYDLHRVITNTRTPFIEAHIRQIIYSLLRSLKYIHSAGVLVNDLKPANIRIDRLSNVVIQDFGLACIQSNAFHIDDVASRWWCAPEVSIDREYCDEKLDIWSVGCIMGELILRRPLFPGSNHLDQLNKIFDILGTPNPSTLYEISTPVARAYLNALPAKPRRNYNKLFGFKYNPPSETPVSGVSPQGIDLLDLLLSFNPHVRPTAEQALAHPFFVEYHESTTEPTLEHPIVDEHQDATYSVTEWKSIVWQMIQEFQAPAWLDDDDDDEKKPL